MRRILVVAAVLAVALGIGGAVLPAGAGDSSTHPGDPTVGAPDHQSIGSTADGEYDTPPDGPHRSVELKWVPSEDGMKAQVRWEVYYPARSATEAERAENGTLDPEWFESEVQRIRTVASNHPGTNLTSSYVGDRVSIGNILTNHYPANQFDDERYSEHGQIGVQYYVTWTGILSGNQTRAVVGPEFAAQLSEGDSLAMRVSRTLTIDAATVNASYDSHRYDRYEWVIGEDPTPRLVFNATTEVDRDTWWDFPVPGSVVLVGSYVATGLLVWALARRSRD